MYCLRLLLLYLPCKTRAFPAYPRSQRYRKTENQRKGGEKIMNQVQTLTGPHIRTANTTRNIMLHVAISLMPALLGSIYFFGIRSLYITGFFCYRLCTD